MSEWKERANKRHEVRHTRSDLPPVKQGSKKDTKKWCRGVAGRDHLITVERDTRMGIQDIFHRRCVHCRKIVETSFPNPFNINEARPVWVTEWTKAND